MYICIVGEEYKKMELKEMKKIIECTSINDKDSEEKTG